MIRIVRLSFEAAHVEDFLAYFEARKEKIRYFEGCSHLELWQDQHDACVYYTYSIWDHPDHLEAYRISEYFQETWKQVKCWFKEKPVAYSVDQKMIL